MSIADEMRKDWNDKKTSPSLSKQVRMAEEETTERQHEIQRDAWLDLGSALYDWCKGAVAGAEEVGRAATARGANVPADYLDEQALEKPELTAEEQQTEDWYQKAVDTFNDETTKPVMVAAALSDLPGVSQLGAMAMLPMMAEDWSQNVEKEGTVQGTVSTALNMVPFVGSYRQMQDPNFQRYAEAHPARAAGLLLMNEAPWLAGTIQAAKHIRLNELTEKFKGNVKKAKEALKAEEDAVRPPKADTPESLKAEVKRDTEFKPKKPKTPQEEVNMANNPKVAEEIDKTIYDAALKKEADNIQAEKVHRGVYGQDIEAVPPSDMSITSVTIREIYETANRIITTRIGNLVTKDKKVLGHYRPKEKIVNVGDTLDLNNLAHEIGHHIDTVLKIEGHDVELVDAAKSRWGHAYDAQEAKQPGTWRGEGIAEFTTEYVLNPDAARQNFPGYYAAFVKKIAEHPEIAKEFETMCQQVRIWKTMEPAERVRGNMVFAGDVKKTMTQRLQETMDKLEASWVDEYAPFKKIIEDFVNRKAIALLQSENPAVVAAAVKSLAPARATALLGFFSDLDDAVAISALEKAYNVPLNKITLGTIYEKLNVIQKDKAVRDYLAKNSQYKGIHEAFSTYSAALHNLDVMTIKNMERVEVLTGKLDKFKAALKESLDKEDVLKNVLEELKDVDEKAFPELARIKEQIEAKLADKKVSKKKEVLEGAINELETTIKDIKEGRNDYKTFEDREALQAVVDNAPKQFVELAENLSGVTENLTTLMVHFGFISAKEAANMRKYYPHYVPLHRDFSLDRLIEFNGSGGSKGKGFVNTDRPLYALSKDGSTRTLIDPIVELYKTTNQLIETGERNKVGQALAKLAEYDGAGELVVEAGENPKAVRGIFSVWIDGKKKNYQAIAPGLYEALTAGDASAKLGLDILDSTLLKGAETLRIGATSTPAFMLANSIKDTFAASFYSKTGLAPIFGTLDGFFRKFDGEFSAFGHKLFSLKSDSRKLADQQLRADFLVQGVPFTTFVGSNKDIARMFAKRTKDASKLDIILDKTVGNAQKINEAIEQAPRLAEFKRMYDKKIKEGYSVQEALFLAGQQARDLTVNFAQAGKKGKFINRYSAFFNASLQGNAKLIKAVGSDIIRTKRILDDIHKGKINPVNAVEKTISDLKAGNINLIEAIQRCPMGTTAWGLMSITLPSIALWYANQDKEWYRNMSYRKKMTNWFIEFAPGVIVSIPKPELPGYIFGSVPERVLDRMISQDPDAVLNSTMGIFLFDSLMSSGVPTAILPIFEWAANWSFFKDRPIVDKKAENPTYPEDEYDMYTSDLAKYSGQVLSQVGLKWFASPMKIDNTFRDVFGSLGSFFLRTTDIMLKDTKFPDRDWRDYTRFTYNPTPNSQNRTSEKFYDLLQKAEDKHKHEVNLGLRKPKQKAKDLKILEDAARKLKDRYAERKKIMGGAGKYKDISPTQRKIEKDRVEEEIDTIKNRANNKVGYRYIPQK